MSLNYNVMSIAMSGSAYAQGQIPQYLISEMIELGLDPNAVKSASEARSLIQLAKSRDEQANSKENTNANAANQALEAKSGESQTLRQKAASLAEKVGVRVSDNETIEDILGNIQAALDNLMKQAAKDGDEALFNLLQGLQNQLDILVAEAKGGEAAQTQLYNYMDMLAWQNKYSLNIN